MTLAIVFTRAMLGMNSPLVTVEAHISAGLPALTLVGLPETAVKESRDRVRSALINSGFEYPAKRMTLNLAPADLPKEGGRYDLPIALAILAASDQIPLDKLDQYEFLGELGLTGEIRYSTGVISAALAANRSNRQLVLSQLHNDELMILPAKMTLLATNLLQICTFLHEKISLASNECLIAENDLFTQEINSDGDLQDIIGQGQAKRALEVTASGGHNLLLLGPPGTGKTMLASRIGSILPKLTQQEALEVAAIKSLINLR